MEILVAKSRLLDVAVFPRFPQRASFHDFAGHFSLELLRSCGRLLFQSFGREAPFPAVHRTDRAPGAQSKQPIVPLSRALSQSAGPRGSPSIGCPGFSISFDRPYAPLASPTHRDNLFAEATGKDTPKRPAAKSPPAASGPTLHGDAPRCILGERLQTPFAELRDGLAAAGPSLPPAPGSTTSSGCGHH